MSNKTLVIVIIGLIVIAAAAAGFFYWQQTKPLKISSDQAATSPDPASPSPDPLAPQPAPAPSPTPQASASCTRDFSQSKLTGNMNLNIQNRQVEMDVKDFGKITLEFYPSDAPKTVENFLRLTDAGYYDCLTFHRVAKGFVIQGGDPNGNGTGGTSAYGKPFADELNANTASYKAGYVKGVLAMANSGPNTNGSQFFIMLADNDLPHNYTIFGKVTMGLDVVDKIGQVAITPEMGPTDGSPVTPVVMQSVKIIK